MGTLFGKVSVAPPPVEELKPIIVCASNIVKIPVRQQDGSYVLIEKPLKQEALEEKQMNEEIGE